MAEIVFSWMKKQDAAQFTKKDPKFAESFPKLARDRATVLRVKSNHEVCSVHSV